MENKFEKYIRLSQANTYNDSLEAYQIILDSGLQLSKLVHDSLPAQERNELVNDALILFQMTMAKGIAVLNLANSLNYYNSIGDFSLTNLVDPMIMTSVVRAQYEAFTNFHNIFNSTTDNDSKQFLYDAWVMAGLKERGRHYVEPTEEQLTAMKGERRKNAEENKLKFQDEQKKIEFILNRMQQNPFYLKLDDKKRKNLDRELKKRTFQFTLLEGEMVKTSWLDMFLKTGASEVFTPMYSILSMGAHPTNVSVFQYAQMFNENDNLQSAKTLLKFSEKIMCFFIADYCTYILKAKEEYQKLPELNKVIIESANKNMRNKGHILSETYDEFSNEIEIYMIQKHNKA